MNELKELKFNDSTIYLKDNLVKSSILPQKVAELNRNIVVQSNSIIEGAVYANKIEIQNGDIDFQGAVFSNLEILINSSAEGNIKFRKSVASADSIVSRATRARIIFSSDINGKKVTLYNAFVSGSIYADEIELENCVVIGGVFATQSIDLNNSIVGTFNSPSVKVSENLYILLPSAFSIEKLIKSPGFRFYNLTLADLGGLFRGYPESSESGKILIDLDKDELRTTLTDDSIQRTIRSYSVVGKVLAADLIDSDKFQNHFLMASASLGQQLLNTYDMGIDSSGNQVHLTIDSIRDFFFNILDGRISIQDLKGDFDISQITKHFN